MATLPYPVSKIKTIFWLIAISFFSYKMAQIILPYTSGRWDIDFLLTKQAIIHLDYYRLAFYAHIYSSIFVLFSGAILFPNYFQKNWPKLHRWTGKLYVGLLLFISAPSALIMAFHANGGWVSQVSFVFLAPFWWWFTYKGYLTARKKQFIEHKKWMARSYALSLSAVSLRVYQMLLGHFVEMDPALQYVMVSWASWVGNLAVAEIWAWPGQLYSAQIGLVQIGVWGGTPQKPLSPDEPPKAARRGNAL